MKWLEVIQIRTGRNRAQQMADQLSRMLANLRQDQTAPRISLFRHSSLPSDFCLHLHHAAGADHPEKSTTALRLISSLRELGMIHHTIWVLEADGKHIDRRGEWCG